MFIISGDTVVAVGRRILPKTEDEQSARDCLKLLSGRSHVVITSVVIVTPTGKKLIRTVKSRVTFKRLSSDEINAYIKTNEWHGKAGGYAIQGQAAKLISAISGSYSAIMGLPLFETAALLQGAGYIK